MYMAIQQAKHCNKINKIDSFDSEIAMLPKRKISNENVFSTLSMYHSNKSFLFLFMDLTRVYDTRTTNISHCNAHLLSFKSSEIKQNRLILRTRLSRCTENLLSIYSNMHNTTKKMRLNTQVSDKRNKNFYR